MLGDTIAAVSTPRGKGGVALLRVSGDRAIEISEKVFCAKNKKSLADLPARQAIYGSILAPDESGAFVPVDDGIAVVFRAPASFTGEDTVELTCHGGILLTEKILAALFAAGAKPAMAGEFTRRAFLNGKLGLSAAEALGLMLDAKTDTQLTLAHTGMSGKLEAQMENIYASLRRLLASVYAKIDYPDEDLADLSESELLAEIEATRASLESLLSTYTTGRSIAEGIATVICGRPNAGKSSLYNRLVGRDAAIVTEVEGTTRDVLSETVPFGKVTLRLFDTAGLHESDDPVERIGIDRAKKTLDEAELVFALFDGTKQPDEDDFKLTESLSGRKEATIALVTKCDLWSGEDETLAFCKKHFEKVLSISTESGEGLAELEELVETLFVDGSIDLRKDPILTSARQYAAVLGAKEAAARAKDALLSGISVELVCSDLEKAMESLSELDGRSVSEDVVSEIFSHFCVGK
ncbi:MAG: tRNA uridine-5-carboxymethylaminomethyl(34) synthesis GTPase MnmE [Clostridia bacterium]|nr:tRNA uridine-5-carboxymethylaminomethyl(34) synthesis GTPase MnmE [Clostridia bacterium]